LFFILLLMFNWLSYFNFNWCIVCSFISLCHHPELLIIHIGTYSLCLNYVLHFVVHCLVHDTSHRNTSHHNSTQYNTLHHLTSHHIIVRSAMEFILTASAEDLTMDSAEFDAQLKEATEKLAAVTN
jgi:hypothetical protein